MNIHEDDLAIESAISLVVGALLLTIMKLLNWIELLP